MIAYLPAIYPDELVYSWFSRYYIYSGCFSHKMALQELFCKRSDCPSKEFIGNLNPDAKAEITKQYQLDWLVLNHTMYPEYARFIPLSDKKTALHHIGEDYCDIHRLFAVLPRMEGERYLRYCPLCAEEDRKQYGETYWHRKHQIRNLSICTKHGCNLKESSIPVKSEQWYTLNAAETSIMDMDVECEKNPKVTQFARYVEAIFDEPIEFNCDIPISAILYDCMSRTRYLKSSGRSRYTKMFTDDMAAYYEKLGVQSIPSTYQIQRILLGKRYDFSVICQIAFFLGATVQELTSPTLTTDQIQKEQNSHYMKDVVPIDLRLLDEETAPILEAVVKGIYDGSANENSRPERVSERIVCREMNLTGYQLRNMPMCKAVFERYTESYPENWARRIIWAYQKLKEQEIPFYWSDIRELSGVKKKNFESVIPFLSKYTDFATADKIIAIVESK